jgi:hypothetical protein
MVGIVIPSIVWLVEAFWVVGLVHPALESIIAIITRMLSIKIGFIGGKRYACV